jgi:putative sigma-54 modulation protein
VTGRHVELTDDIRAYTEEKASKLHRYYDRIHEIEVIFGHESEQFTAEIIVRADAKNPFIASETGPDSFVLVDVVVEKLERQIKRHKEQRRNHKHDGKPEVNMED